MRVLALVLLAGCGRVAFDPVGAIDDASTSGTGDSTPFANANRAFVTSRRLTLAEISNGITGVDAVCQTLAMNANLDGTFVALVSSSTVDAIDRISSSRGWVRTDGAPVFDTAQALFGSYEMYAPINLDEHAQPIPANEFIYTDTSTDGKKYGNGCGDWSGANQTIGIGSANWGATNSTAYISFVHDGSGNCGDNIGRVYCLETGKTVPITPRAVPANVRIIFIGNAPPTNPGLSGLDKVCTDDATAAGLPGTFKAVVPTTSATTVSRFTPSSAPIYRVDGTRIADDITHFFDSTTPLQAFVNQTASGTYVDGRVLLTGGTPTAVGTVTTTCNNWTDTSATSSGHWGYGGTVGANQLWTAGTFSCWQITRPSTLCLSD